MARLNRLQKEELRLQILALRGKGFARRRIVAELGIPDADYGKAMTLKEKEESDKEYKRNREQRAAKIKDPSLFLVLKEKVKKFQGKGVCTIPFSFQDVLDKFGETPSCYLSGVPIDLLDPTNYSLDHVIPVFRGGSSNLDNLQLCNSSMNYMKHVNTPAEFIELCQKVIDYQNSNKEQLKANIIASVPLNLSVY